jgi:serine/threonine protein kinase
MSVDPSQAKAIFLEAVEKHDPDQWPGFLDQACAGQPDLRGHVAALLKAHREAGTVGFQSSVEGPVPPRAHLGVDVEHPGAVIGPYKLLEQIGEGGFGVVFLAEQSQPVRRKVALKVLKPGMDTRSVVARFEAERQALALMDHPNIAKVFDGGQTPPAYAGGSPRPYFVMELVKGVPITDFCDQNHLTPRQRLELFLPVCQAVQHAHHKGIIHRDLKPNNVLVSRHDTTPVVKVIDFGVAKALGQELTDKTLFTGIAQMIGTPLYMSPEQAGMSDLDVDTRSDIYSLGVMLYELLAGTTPFDKERFKKAAYDEIRRIIREEEPPKPSTRLSESKDSLPSISAQRQTEPARLTKLVRGELDWIVMKALEKDRNRRYETANGFAMDVQRYLADEPVQACPPTARYRFRKFARRNKAALATAIAVALVVLLAVVGFAVGSLLLWREKERTGRERDRAEANAEEARGRQREAEQARQRTREALNALTDGVVGKLFAKQARLGEDERQFLRKVQRFYEEFAAEQGETEEARANRADGYCRVASISQKLGELAEAERSYLAGLFLYGQLAADFPAQPKYRLVQARRREEFAGLYRKLGQPQKAEAAHRAVLDSLADLAPDFSAKPVHRELTAMAHSNLGILLYELARLEEAKSAWQTAVALQTKLAEEFPGEAEYRAALSNTYNNLGHLLLWSGRPKEAEPAYRAALNRRAELVKEFPTVPEHRMELAMTQGNLAVALHHMGQTEEAVKACRASRNLRADLAKDFPTVPDYRHDLAQSYKNLALMLHHAGRLPEAMAAFQDALAVQVRLVEDFRKVPEYRQNLADIHNDVGALHRVAGRLDEAEKSYGAARDVRAELVKEFGGNPEYANGLAGTLVNLANVARDRKDHAAARNLLEQALPHHHAALKANPKNPAYRRYYRNNTVELAAALIHLGDHAAAVRKADELAGLNVFPIDDTYNAACYVASCIPLAQKDAKLGEMKRQELSADYASRSIALLKQAVAKGYNDAPHMTKDPDLDVLRGREDFKKLIAELEKKGSSTPSKDGS